MRCMCMAALGRFLEHFFYSFSCCFFILNYPISDFSSTFYWFYCGHSLERQRVDGFLSMLPISISFSQSLTTAHFRFFIFDFPFFRLSSIQFYFIGFCTMPLLLLLLLLAVLYFVASTWCCWFYSARQFVPEIPFWTMWKIVKSLKNSDFFHTPHSHYSSCIGLLRYSCCSRKWTEIAVLGMQFNSLVGFELIL